MTKSLALLTGLMSVLCCAHAQGPGAWLTPGTAATALGGTPELTLKLDLPQQGSCSFTFENEAVRSTLDIVVRMQPSSSSELSCPAASPSLAAIGNQAVICHLASPARADKQLVLSRVRGTYFTIVLTAERKDSTVPDAEKQRDRITLIAEQVAGNLF